MLSALCLSAWSNLKLNAWYGTVGFQIDSGKVSSVPYGYYGMAWHGMGMAWCGVVWYGLVIIVSVLLCL